MKILKKTVRGLRYVWPVWLALVGAFSMPAHAATTVYFNDFQSAVGSAWTTTAASGLQIASAPNPDYARLFLGQYGDDTLTLSLNNLPTHNAVTISFSLYVIDSWDGNDTTIVNGVALGPDHWNLSLGNTTLFDQTFSNGNPAGQSYNGQFSAPGTQPSCSAYSAWTGPAGSYAPMTGANECYSLGYKFSYPYGYKYSNGTTCTNPSGCPEAMDSVYDLSITTLNSASSIALNFSGYGLQGLADESWGLDNVQVQVSSVPLPAAAWLLGSGLLGLAGMARRRRSVDAQK